MLKIRHEKCKLLVYVKDNVYYTVRYVNETSGNLLSSIHHGSKPSALNRRTSRVCKESQFPSGRGIPRRNQRQEEFEAGTGRHAQAGEATEGGCGVRKYERFVNVRQV